MQRIVLGEYRRMNVAPLRDLIAAPSKAFGMAVDDGCGEAPATAAAMRDGFRRCTEAIERLTATVTNLSARVDRMSLELEAMQSAKTATAETSANALSQQQLFESAWCTEDDD